MSRSHRFGAATIFGIALFALPSTAQDAREMTATTSFVQSKATDGTGHVTFRVGGVFADKRDAARRLSLTFICEPEPPAPALSLFIVQQGAGAPRTGTAEVGIQVDGAPELRIKA